jgi:hypothetical protein
MEEELKIKMAIASSTQKDYEVLINKLKNEEKISKEREENIGKKEKDIIDCEKEIKKIFEDNQFDRERLRRGCEGLENNKSDFEKEKERFGLEKESVERDKETIKREKEAILNDRLHLYSQQETLKLAYEEVRKYDKSNRQ